MGDTPTNYVAIQIQQTLDLKERSQVSINVMNISEHKICFNFLIDENCKTSQSQLPQVTFGQPHKQLRTIPNNFRQKKSTLRAGFEPTTSQSLNECNFESERMSNESIRIRYARPLHHRSFSGYRTMTLREYKGWCKGWRGMETCGQLRWHEGVLIRLRG